MSCRRAYDLDLAAFLRDPRAPELEEFVEHYPRCPACAAEVRAWTEVHLALGRRHPAPAELLAYQDGTLAADARATLERHLTTCPGCSEELRALERFDAIREASATTAPSPPRPAPTGSAVRRVGRVLWHPAFAYAVALLLLLPVLAQQPWDRGRLPLERPRADDTAGLPPAPAPSHVETPRPAAPPPEPLHDERERVAPEQAPPSRPFASDDLARSQRAPAPPPVAAASDAAATRGKAAAGASAPALTLDDDRRTLAIPLAPSLRSRDAVEVRIRDAAGTRELRQRVAPREVDRLVLELPRDWLTPGAWSVEVQAPGAVRRFTLHVP